jgi:hypothetical protein
MFKLVIIQCGLRLQRENRYVKRNEKLAECLSIGSYIVIVQFLVSVYHNSLSESCNYKNISISTPVYCVSAPKFCLLLSHQSHLNVVP